MGMENMSEGKDNGDTVRKNARSKKHNVEQLAEVVKMRRVFFHSSTRVKATLNACGKRTSHSPGAPRRLQNLVFMLENKVNGDIAMSIAQCQQEQKNQIVKKKTPTKKKVRCRLLTRITTLVTSGLAIILTQESMNMIITTGKINQT